MINVRSCDICREPLGAHVTRIEMARGRVTFRPRERWSIEPVAAGLRVRMTCPTCDQYMREAVRHLASLVAPHVAPVSSDGDGAASGSAVA